MPVTVSFGADFGATVIKTTAESGGVALVGKESKWRVALEFGGTFIETVTDMAGVPIPGGVITCDKLGTPPLCLIEIDTLGEPPAELWLQQVSSAPGKGWRRYRLGGAGVASGPGGGTTIVEGGVERIGWVWTGADIASGVAADPAPVFKDSHVDEFHPVIQALGGATSGPTVIQFRARDAATGAVFDVGDTVTLPAGASSYTSNSGFTRDIPAGEVWAEMVTAPPAGVGGSAAATVGASAVFNSGTSTAANYTLPLPAGGAAGNTVFAFVSSQAPTPNLGAAWTRHVNVESVPTGTQAPRARVTVFSAPWSATLDMALTLTPFTPPGGSTANSSPVVATVVIVPNADLAAPIGNMQTQGPANAEGPVQNYTALTATEASDLTFVVTTWQALAGVTGQDSSASPAGTEVSDAMTSRSAVTNIGQNVTRYGALASGAVFPATAVTVANGTGSLTGITTAGAIITVKRGATVGAAKKIKAWLQIKPGSVV